VTFGYPADVTAFSALIIDADEAASSSIRSALAPFGFELTATHDDSEAMSLAKTATPDIIFLRVELPHVSGFSVCNKLRRADETKYIPLVLYASDVSAEIFDQHRKLKTHADDYLVLPFRHGELVAAVRGLMQLPEPGRVQTTLATRADQRRTVRAFEPDRDRAAVQALDIGFETAREFIVHRSRDRLELVAVPLATPCSKRFPLDLDADPWTDGYVAIDEGSVCGFIATSLGSWSSRLTIHHLYVARAHRRRGMGRALVEHVIAAGRAAGAVTAWAETSNRNYPGVQAYERLGFVLCGFDLSLYSGTPAEGEFAVYLARDLREPERGRS